MAIELNNTRTHRLLLVVMALLVLTVLVEGGLLVRGYVASHRILPHPESRPFARLRSAAQPGDQIPAARPAAPHTVWDDFSQMEEVHEEINRMFEQAFNQYPPLPPSDATASNRTDSRDALLHDPFAHIQRMREQVDTLFAQAMQNFEHFHPPAGFDDGWTGLSVTPAMSVRDEGQAYEVTVHLPGVNKDDIRVTLNGSILTITTEQQQTQRTGTPQSDVQGRSQNAVRFERRIRLPAVAPHPEDVTASYENGVLQVIIPKAPSGESAEAHIPIK
jgi:HSP20 family protein